MSVETIIKLKPKTGSAADIQTAIDTANGARDDTLGLAQQLEAKRGQVLVRGSDTEVHAHEEALAEARLQVEQIDAFLAALVQPLADAKKAEKRADLCDRLALTGYEAKCTKFADAWRTKYAAAAATIRDILMLEAEALAVQREAAHITRQLAELGETVTMTPSPAFAAIGGALSGGASLGGLVQLVGLLGAPNVPNVMEDRKVTGTVTEPDWDSDSARDREGKPLRTCLVSETRFFRDTKPLRDDFAFWFNGRPNVRVMPVSTIETGPAHRAPLSQAQPPASPELPAHACGGFNMPDELPRHAVGGFKMPA